MKHIRILRSLLPLLILLIAGWGGGGLASARSARFTASEAHNLRIHIEGIQKMQYGYVEAGYDYYDMRPDSVADCNYTVRTGDIVIIYIEGTTGYTPEYSSTTLPPYDPASMGPGSYRFEMPAEDAVMNVRMKYNPASPGDPAINFKYPLSISATPDGAGYISSGSSEVTAGESVWLHAYPNDGYRFVKWTHKGELVSEASAFSFTMPAEPTQLTAHFVYDPESPTDPEPYRPRHMVSVKVMPPSAGYTSRGNAKVREDDEYHVELYLNDGYRFLHWVQNGEIVENPSTYFQSVMGTEDVELIAVCKYDPASPGQPGTNRFDAQTGHLVMDDFTPGYLSDALYGALRHDSNRFAQVNKVSVIGEMEYSDWYAFSNLDNLKELDLSQVVGAEEIPDWALESISGVEKIVLGSGITSIGWKAFWSLKTLQSVTIYAMVPPKIEYNTFFQNGVIIMVPLEALNAYESADIWKEFTILPITGETRSLTLSLPEEAADGRYRNYTMELINGTTGAKLRSVVSDRLSYTFSNLTKGDTFTAVLYSKSGVEVARVENITIEEIHHTVVFSDILSFRTLKLRVCDAEDADITTGYTAEWWKVKDDAPTTFISKGTSVSDLLAGERVMCRLTLGADLAKRYHAPEDHYFTVGEEDVCTIALRPFRSLTLHGKVESSDHTPIAGAGVSIRQKVGEKYTSTTVTRTVADGTWSATVLESPLTEITYTAAECVSAKSSIEGFAEDTDSYDAGTVSLRSVVGARITYGFTYFAPGMEEKREGYDDWANVVFEVYNLTQRRAHTDLSVQYPMLAVLDENIAAGDSLRITAISKTGDFPNIQREVTIPDTQRAEVTFDIVGKGGISASYGATENPHVTAMLYDSKGELIQTARYQEGKIEFTGLADGVYTLITMAHSDLMNAVLRLSGFAELGLVEGRDYVKSVIEVSRGVWSVIVINVVPSFDESIFHFTNAQTNFSANKSSIVTGNYLTLRAFIDFKSAYKKEIEDVVLTVDLPEACDLVPNSVIQGAKQLAYTLDGRRLSIALGRNYSSEVRFCVIPTKGGTFTATAGVTFDYKGRTVSQPIGTAQCEVKDLEISVPPIVASPTFTVTGIAPSRSTVTVYNGTLALATVTATPSGNWRAQVTLPNPEEGVSYMIHALVNTIDEHQLETKTCLTTYDPHAILPYTISMTFYNSYNRGNEYVSWNLIDKTVSTTHYDFYKTADFTYVVTFNAGKADKVCDVEVYVKTTSGAIVMLPAIYNAAQKVWVATGRFSSASLPINASVRYRLLDKTEYFGTAAGEDGAPDVTSIIDPSGYVYEAVASNRVEGVKASIYYKETKEDMYGEKYEEVVLWNAEEYAQKNPLFTDAAGMYAWDVPQGLWQVRFEKEGYQSTQSEWLPVPPPQLDVNVGIMQYSQPKVTSARAYEEGVEVEFDKYMDQTTLTPQNIYVTAAGTVVEGEIVLLDSSVANPYIKPDQPGYDTALRYASKIRFVPAQRLAATTGEVRITVSKAVKSYAGVGMATTFSQVLDVEKEVQKITADPAKVVYGAEKQITVYALPAEAAAGKTLKAESTSGLIVSLQEGEYTLDDEGKCTFTIQGQLPGHAELLLSIDGVGVTGEVPVDVVRELIQAQTPTASRADGSTLYRHSKVSLSTDTQDGVIYFTTDGTSPLDEEGTRRRYSVPVDIDTDMQVQAFTTVESGGALASEVAAYRYELLRNDLEYRLPAGWTWISHSFDVPVPLNAFTSDQGVSRIQGQTQEVGRDTNSAWVGALTQMSPMEAYKVQTSAPVSIARIREVAQNPATPILLRDGWNWLAYTSTQSMSVNEALAPTAATRGDVIVGQDGFAQYDGEKWVGTLQLLTPGLGYLYQSQGTQEVVYNTSIVSTAASRAASRRVAKASDEALVADKHAHPSVMPLIANVTTFDGEALNNADYAVAAFCGSECRGVGSLVDGKVMMSIYGQPGDLIAIHLRDINSDQQSIAADHLEFGEKVVGSLDAPAALRFSSTSTGVIGVNDGKVRVEAVGRLLSIRGIESEKIEQVEVYDLEGHKLLHTAAITEGVVKTTSLPQGVYAVVVKAAGVYTYHKITLR